MEMSKNLLLLDEYRENFQFRLKQKLHHQRIVRVQKTVAPFHLSSQF